MKDVIKIVVVILLAICALALAYYFLGPKSARFDTGSEVDQGTFSDLFQGAKTVYILMDVRGVRNSTTSRNILQCGVDFAGSSGMGGKQATYRSIGDDGCVDSDGKHPDEYCFSSLSNGMTIYVHEGETTSFHTNGMVVGVGSNYSLGNCGIKRIN